VFAYVGGSVRSGSLWLGQHRQIADVLLLKLKNADWILISLAILVVGKQVLYLDTGLTLSLKRFKVLLDDFSLECQELIKPVLTAVLQNYIETLLEENMISHLLIEVEVSRRLREASQEISVTFLRTLDVFWFEDAGHKQYDVKKGLLKSDL